MHFDKLPPKNLSTSRAALSGSLSHHARAPAKFQVGMEYEDVFIQGCEAVTTRFNALGGIADLKLPDAVVVAAFEANSGVLCPGFLGSRRPQVEAKLNGLFGVGRWETQHVVAGRLAPEAAALRLYQEAYAVHFRENPAKLEWLCRNFSDVYDTDPSNVQSKFDYNHQEMPHKGRHLHDIAIRRAVHALGRTFEGAELLQVRGPKSEGFCLSPGEVPFPFDGQIPKTSVPNQKPWWKPNTIEDFYQRSRRIVVKEFMDSSYLNSEISHGSEPSTTYCARLASRFFLRMLPVVTSAQVSLGQLNELPWMLDRHSFPTDSTGLPRPVSAHEGYLIAKSLNEQFDHFFRKSSNQSALVSVTPWLGFEKSQEFVEVLRKISEGGEPTAQEAGGFPDFSDMRVWSEALRYFWQHTYAEGKRPLHLARDGWIPMEYLSYKSDLIGHDREHCKRSVYVPGTSLRASLVTKNIRGNCADLEQLVGQLAQFAVQAQEESRQVGQTLSIRNLFCEKVRNWIDQRTDDGSDGTSIWRPIYEQIIAQFPEGTSRLVVVDSDGTGKSAQFIATLLEHFARQVDPNAKVDVLLGGMKGTAVCPALGVPNIAEMYGLSSDDTSGRHLPDARWPFSFAEYSPEPKFNVEKHPSRYLVLLWRSLQLYNQAVRDSYQVSDRSN